MRSIFLSIAFFIGTLSLSAQQKSSSTPDSTKKLLTVEASCGQCKLGLPGKDCNLAIRFNGQAYFVDGTGIDDHGDAHASDGFCNSIRKAQVQGEILEGRFKLSLFKLMKEEPAKVKQQ